MKPGRFRVIPMYLKEKMRFVKPVHSIGPWGLPIVAGFVATLEDSPMDPRLLVILESPIQVLAVPQALDKPALELLHLHRFCSDHQFGVGLLPYSSMRPGNDPPDFVCETPSGERGVECTTFALTSRRQVHGLLNGLRQAILEEKRGRFGHLFGTLVILWFLEGDGLGKPPSRAHTGNVNELVASLAGLKVDVSRGVVDYAAGLPKEAPDIGIEYTASGCGLYATPFEGAVPDTIFFAKTGFELAVAYQTEHAAADEWQSLHELIRQKDILGNEELVVSFGAPDHHGFIYPAEELIFQSMLLRPAQRRLEATQLRTVLLHSWATGQIVELYPEYRVRSMRTFTGFMPPYHTM